jgi:hypothetical protein
MCICPPCFYGIRCHFNTKGFGLSLDAILGYHILPHLSLIQQLPNRTIQFSIDDNLYGGRTDEWDFVSDYIFKNKIVHEDEVDCGLFLLFINH